MAFVEYVNNTVIGRVHRDTRDPCTNLYARLHKSIVFFFFLFFRSFLSFPLLSSLLLLLFPFFRGGSELLTGTTIIRII